MRCPTLAVLFLMAAPERAWADDETPAAVQVVQRRQFELRHELTVSAGFLPLDAFYKGATVTAGYTYHFNPHFAWRVGRGTFVQAFSTGLRNQVEGLYGLRVTDTPEVRWMVGSDLVWNAFYGKAAFMNFVLLHGSIYLLLGADLLLTQAAAKSEAQPAVSLGGGLRVFVTQWLSFRLECINHFAIGPRSFNVVDLQLAAAVNLGS
jgi:outer membrane beta-barrel protein